MAIYNGFAGNGSIPLSKTYKQAAQQINLGCGPNFASTTVQTVASAATLLSAQFTITALLSVMGALFSLA